MKLLLTSLAFILISYSAFSQGLATSDNNSEILQLIDKIESLDDHCEVPCGIYGDSLRISLIKEHSSTVAKAMTQINKLSKADELNFNQLVRWVNNKESHAKEIQDIVSQYFLHQRVKLVKEGLPRDKMGEAITKYNNQLGSLHRVLVYAMKCKQSTDKVHVELLNQAIADFEAYYFHGHKH